MGQAIQLNKDSFEVAITGKVALLDFWAECCGMCRMLSPVIDQVAEEVGDQAVVAKICTDTDQEVAIKFGVRSLPTIVIIKDGQVVKQFVGVQSRQTLIDAIKTAL